MTLIASDIIIYLIPKWMVCGTWNTTWGRRLEQGGKQVPFYPLLLTDLKQSVHFHVRKTLWLNVPCHGAAMSIKCPESLWWGVWSPSPRPMPLSASKTRLPALKSTYILFMGSHSWELTRVHGMRRRPCRSSKQLHCAVGPFQFCD